MEDEPIDRSHPNYRGKQQVVHLPSVPLMIKGSRAQFHMNRHRLKMEKHRFDAGIDLYPALDIIKSQPLGSSWVRLWVHTHVHMSTVPGVMGVLQARSSTADKLGGAIVIPSIIDPGYDGELLIRVQCLKQDEDQTRTLVMDHIVGEKALAQLILQPYIFPQFGKWDDKLIEELGRSGCGYGSTDSIQGGNIIPGSN